MNFLVNKLILSCKYCNIMALYCGLLLQDLLEQNEYLEKHVKKLKKQLKAAYKRVTQSQHESSEYKGRVNR